MASKLLVLALLSSLALLALAAPSAEEIALRNAIKSKGPAMFTLKKNIALTDHLPPLADKKILTVQSANLPGAPFTIDGQKKFHLFRRAPDAIVNLTLSYVKLTGSRFAAVSIGGEGTALRVTTVTFANNKRGLDLYIVNAEISNSVFSGHKRSAIVTQSEEGLGDGVSIFMCQFLYNSAEKGAGGGAIRVLRYASITADKCSFSSNTVDYNGGAVRIFNAYARITRSGFYNNKAKRSGGALSMYNSGLQLWDTTFSNNTAVNEEGGAVRVWADDQGSTALFRNVIFKNNKALNKRGGAFVLYGNSEAQFCIQPQFEGNTGGKVASNGYIAGLGNIISKEPGITIPLLTKAKGAELTQQAANCTALTS